MFIDCFPMWRGQSDILVRKRVPAIVLYAAPHRDATQKRPLLIGCEQVQGYSIAFPMPDDQARTWLSARSPTKARLKMLQGSLA
jgi:hypothetical protein